MSNKFIENKNVAIVGNAISLLDLDYGKKIDNHEVVIRINNTSVFHTDAAGTKIDIWAFNDRINYEARLISRAHKLKKKPESYEHFTAYQEYYKNGVTLDLALANVRYGGVFWNDDWRNDDVDRYEHSVEIKKDIIREFEHPSCGIVLVSIIASLNPATVSLYGFDWKRTATFQAESNHIYMIEREDENGNIIHRYDSQHLHNYDREEEYIRNQFLTRDNWRLYW